EAVAVAGRRIIGAGRGDLVAPPIRRLVPHLAREHVGPAVAVHVRDGDAFAAEGGVEPDLLPAGEDRLWLGLLGGERSAPPQGERGQPGGTGPGGADPAGDHGTTPFAAGRGRRGTRGTGAFSSWTVEPSIGRGPVGQSRVAVVGRGRNRPFA